MPKPVRADMRRKAVKSDRRPKKPLPRKAARKAAKRGMAGVRKRARGGY